MYTALPFLLLYLSLTFLLCVCDIRSGMLPDKFTCPLLWSGLAYQLCCTPELLSQAVWGAIGGYLVFATLYWGYWMIRGQEGLGYGDVKFLAALGAWHGWQSLAPLIAIAASLASLCYLMLALRKGSTILKNPLPFGPFLATAGLIIGWKTFYPAITGLLL